MKNIVVLIFAICLLHSCNKDTAPVVFQDEEQAQIQELVVMANDLGVILDIDDTFSEQDYLETKELLIRFKKMREEQEASVGQ